MFDTETDAHGWVRGKVTFRRGGRRVVCALPKLMWSTSLAFVDEDGDGSFDEGDEFGDDDGDGEFDDDDEFDEDEGDPGDDGDVDPDGDA